MNAKKEIIEVFCQKLAALNFSNIVMRQNKINFGITNQGQSTDENWKTFLVSIEFNSEFYTISIIFNYNNKIFSFKGNLKSIAVDMLQIVNKKLSTGVFKLNQAKGIISLKSVSVYSQVDRQWWDTLVYNSFTGSLCTYKYFAYALVRIISGVTDLPALLKECIRRSNGKLSAESSSEASEGNSSDSSEENKPSESLLKLLSSVKALQDLLSVCDDGQSQSRGLSALEYLKDSSNHSKFVQVLETIYRAGVEIVNLKLRKLLVEQHEGRISKLILRKFKYLAEVEDTSQQQLDKYVNEVLMSFNRDLAESFKIDSTNIVNKSNVNIIHNSHFQLADIRSSDNIIGNGGFGVIYRNFLFDIPVAIKFPKSEANNGRQTTKLIAEYKMLQSLDHENIIKTFGFVEVRGKYGIVMELCSAGGLNTVIRSNVSMKMKTKLSIMLKVLKAIEYLHLKGIVHLDIKPHNIILDNNMNPKIADFGLCQKTSHRGLKKTGYTLTYASPEQIKGASMTSKVDIWSFAMTLYYVVTSISPYDYLNKQANKKMEKLQFYHEIYNNKRTPKIPENIELDYPQLTKLIREMWRTDPDGRPNSKVARIRLTEIYNNIA